MRYAIVHRLTDTDTGKTYVAADHGLMSLDRDTANEWWWETLGHVGEDIGGGLVQEDVYVVPMAIVRLGTLATRLFCKTF